MPGTMLSALQFYLTSSSPPYEADFFLLLHYSQDFPGGSLVKNPPANAGDSGSIPGLGRSLGEGNGSPSQDSCLENPMDREAWWVTVHGVAKELDMT